MQWPWKKKIKTVKAEDEQIEKAVKLIDAVIYPQIKKLIEALNKHLVDEKVRVGVEIKWFFDKVE